MIARPTSSEIPRARPTPIPTLAGLLNREAAEFGVEVTVKVNWFEEVPVRDAEAIEADTPLLDDSIEV